ncbi:MAG: hypothetical protein ACFFCV_07035 [Promethearchaeota archaeon]
MKKVVSFKVNEYISLKLKDGITNIFTGGKFFIQCMKLLLNLQTQDTEDYDEINSIDDVAYLAWQKSDFNESNELTPEQEFMGHCSNLQVGVKHNYDTRLLHSNLGFPLLKKLVEVGDLLTKRVFKEEIANI